MSAYKSIVGALDSTWNRMAHNMRRGGDAFATSATHSWVALNGTVTKMLQRRKQPVTLSSGWTSTGIPRL